MKDIKLNILHADDDTDDCKFFKDALAELQLPTNHASVHDGEELMQYLSDNTNELPHILFLDLNMPLKNGAECLSQINQDKRLKQLTTIIFTTSYDQELVNRLYQNGAHYYIRKPADFTQFKKLIQNAFLSLIAQKNMSQPPIEDFVLTA